MKIVLKKAEPFRIYHHPCDVVIRSKSQLVAIMDNGESVEEFELIKKDVRWVTDTQSGTEEIMVILTVK